MKSFLHRVAASVVRPQPSLHPFVESIYPAAPSRKPDEPQFQFENVEFPTPVEHAAERIHRPASLKEPSRQPAPALTQPAAAPATRLSTSPEHEDYQALLPQSGIEVARVETLFSKSNTDPASAASLSEQPVSSSALPAFPQPDRFRATRESAPSVDHSIPQAEVTGATPPVQPRTLGEIQAALTRPNPRRQSPQIPAAPRNAPQQPDNVEIHIGRIEVVAVPAPAPRPAASPAHKGLSLDEYLSRRNGRLG